MYLLPASLVDDPSSLDIFHAFSASPSYPSPSAIAIADLTPKPVVPANMPLIDVDINRVQIVA